MKTIAKEDVNKGAPGERRDLLHLLVKKLCRVRRNESTELRVCLKVCFWQEGGVGST